MQDMTNHQSEKKRVPSPLCPRSRVLREKVRMRGYKINAVIQFHPLAPTLLCPRNRIFPVHPETGHKGEGVNGNGTYLNLKPHK
jgi:hypothetical protein